MRLCGASIFGIAGIRPTDAERRAGRLLRAPDHDGATGDNGSDGASGSDGGSAAGDAGSGAAADGAQGAGGQGADQGGGAADGGSGGDGAGGSILGEVGKSLDGAAEGAKEEDAGDGADKGDGGGKGDEGLTFKPSDDADPVAILGAPEAYALAVPAELEKAGMTFDKEVFDLVEPTIRDLNLSNDAAQALVNAYAEKVLPIFEKRANEQADNLGADMRRGWSEESQKLFDGKEGRDSFDAAKALAKQAFIRLGLKGDAPILGILEESGLGSHPDMLTTFVNLGRLVGEAGIDLSQGGGSPPLRAADRIYGKPIPRE